MIQIINIPLIFQLSNFTIKNKHHHQLQTIMFVCELVYGFNNIFSTSPTVTGLEKR